MMEAEQLMVAVRVRPINVEERARHNFQCVFPLDKKRILLVDPEKFENNILRQNRQHERNFEFDAAFGPTSSQDDVHEATTSPIINSVISGYNATVFAYGATGSGKTYTMIGTKDKPGLMTLLTKALYEQLDEKCYVNLSYMEIYNEIIRDLLNPNGPDLDLLEDDKGNIRVPGLSTVRAPNMTKIMQILQEGNLRRTQEATQANQTSSRSHALLQVVIVKNNSLFSKLFMIDLAGSERASNTQNRGLRLKEGAAINRSLLALGNVINSLSSKQTKYINYRDSKLTRLLKDSLGGNARTCMIAHVTPSSSNFDETYNTLMYAARAKNITNKLIRNRPASADQAYSETVVALRREYDMREMKSSASTNALLSKPFALQYERALSRQKKGQQKLNGIMKNGERKNSQALFTQLKEQYVALSEKQQRLRERLMDVNREAYSLEMSIISKKAIIAAWEKHNKGDKPADTIERLKEDAEKINDRLLSLNGMRSKIERALKKSEDLGISLEGRIRPLATSSEQKEVVQLLVRMSQIEAQRISALNDLAIQDLIMDKKNTSISKLQKYENLAGRLISGDVHGIERKRLEEEYRIIRNQFHYHLLPLKNMPSTKSWNSLLLPRLSSNMEISAPKSAKKSETALPVIVNGRERVLNSAWKSSDDENSYESLSEIHDHLPDI